MCGACDSLFLPLFPRMDVTLSPHVYVEAAKGGVQSPTDPFVISVSSPHLRAGLQLTSWKETSRLKMISCECKGWGVVSGGQVASWGLLSPHLAPQITPSHPETRPMPINSLISLSDICFLFRLILAVPPLVPRD